MVETQGAMGIENQLSFQDIGRADVVLIASDIEIEHRARFAGSKIHCVTIEEVLTDPASVLCRCQELLIQADGCKNYDRTPYYLHHW